MAAARMQLVSTIRERCRVCYTCVRECPAKAIRIAGAQAEVIPARCIGCGNCVRVCSQHAKLVCSSTGEVAQLLASGRRVAACLAPSFPAEFAELDAGQLAGALRMLGFSLVVEVAFAADLVARATAELLEADPDRCYISTACPAVVAYVERYHPALVEYLAPIASPMVAMARVVHALHGDDVATVFIGPCVAKKGEAEGALDAALTFVELREMLRDAGIDAAAAEPVPLDPPHPGLGALFPLTRGILQAAGIAEDLLEGSVVAAAGRTHFSEVIKEFESGDLDLNARLLDLLCCDGCIMGSGMTTRAPLFRRRALISRHVRSQMHELDRDAWEADVERAAAVDLSQAFKPDDQREIEPSEDEVHAILARMGKPTPGDELNCTACGYDTCREHAVAICRGLAESEMCLPYTIDRLADTVRELNVSHEQLASTQAALMHSERLASMGQLAAGIAHEVNNPLGVVLLYAHMILEECDRTSPMRGDLEMIATQADRCKKIVSGLLNFARQNKVLLQEASVRDLVVQAVRTVPVPDEIEVSFDLPPREVGAELDRDQMIQVLSNLIGNAVEAMQAGGRLLLRAHADEERLVLVVEDSGTGIGPEHMNRIFEPFFTTKPMGKGTGLGLPVSYGIVKMHRGDIRAESNADAAAGPTWTRFTVTLPRRARD